MSVDKDTVRRVARLARIAVPEERVEPLAAELNSIFAWVEKLQEVDVEGVVPMASVAGRAAPWRQDTVTDGGVARELMANAPESEETFFVVPKVVE